MSQRWRKKLKHKLETQRVIPRTMFSHYEFICEKISREIAKSHLGKHSGGTTMAERAMYYSAIADPVGFPNSMDAFCFFEEWRQIKLGNHTIFIEDQSLINMIYRAKFDVKPEEVQLPFAPTLRFCFPENTIIDGQRLRGCLFSYATNAERQADFRNFTYKVFGKAFDLKNKTNGESAIRKLSLNFNNKEEGDGSGFFHLYAPDNMLSAALADPNSLQKTIGHTQHDGSLPLTDEQNKLQYVLARFCLGICIYLKAFPTAVKEGFPTSFGQLHVMGDLGHQHTVLRPDGKETHPHASPGEHLRSMHFRALRHPRFARDTDGSIRIIPVSETWVNKSSTPHTVIKNAS